MKSLRFVSFIFAMGLVAACETTQILEFADSCPPLTSADTPPK